MAARFRASIMLHRRYRWTAFPAIAVVAACAYLWAVATPRVGEPPALPPPVGEKLWSFGFVGDTQLGEGIVEEVFDRFERAGVDFVLHLGDIVDDAASDEQWNEVLSAVKKHHIRLRPVVGNHDRLIGTSDRGETRFREFFPELSDTFYHFSHRGLTFLMLNSERSFLPGTEQARFLTEELPGLASTTIVCLHRPVFTCGHRDLANQFVRRVCLHSRWSIRPRGWYYRGIIIITTAQSRSTASPTWSAAAAAANSIPQRPDGATAAFCAGVNHFGLVDVYADRLDVRVIDLDGNEIDRFAVERDPQARTSERSKRRPTDALRLNFNEHIFHRARLRTEVGDGGRALTSSVVPPTFESQFPS